MLLKKSFKPLPPKLPTSSKKETKKIVNVKMKGKTKTKPKKGKGKVDECVDDEEDDDDENDDELDEEDDDNEEDDEEDERDEIAAHEERLAARASIKAEREKIKARKNALALEVKQALDTLSSTSKAWLKNRRKETDSLSTLPHLDSPFELKSKVLLLSIKDTFCGQSLLEHHAVEWVSIQGSSRSRFLTTLGEICILEHAIIRAYRPFLLALPDSAAAYIRLRVEELTKDWRTTHIRKGLRQSKLTSTSSSKSVKTDKFKWADGLSFDRVAASHSKFEADKELDGVKIELMRRRQTEEVQRVVKSLEALDCTWDVVSPMPRKSYATAPQVTENIQDKIIDLVTVRIFYNIV